MGHELAAIHPDSRHSALHNPYQNTPSHAPDGLVHVCRFTQGWAQRQGGSVRTEECLPHLTSTGLWGGL